MLPGVLGWRRETDPAATRPFFDVLPGQPISQEHRAPEDDLRNWYDRNTADPLTKLNALTIMSTEHQTRDYYINIGPTFSDPVARQLYAEIASIEEQHVTQYESSSLGNLRRSATSINLRDTTMRQATDMGMNRTGTGMSPVQAKQMSEAAQQAQPPDPSMRHNGRGDRSPQASRSDTLGPCTYPAR
jgi:hypothetical protein